MVTLLPDLALVGMILGMAAWANAVRTDLAAVVGFIAYGILLTLAWVRLAAVDVALTEAAVGSGVTGALLLFAVRRLRPAEDQPVPGAGPGARTLAAALSVAVTTALGAVVLLLPEPAPTLAPQAAVPLPDLGVGNAVTAVLIAYRSMDTLLEKVVLLLALMAVWSLAPDAAWGGAPRNPAEGPPSGALILMGRMLPPVGFVVAVYMLWVGAIEPGGAFQAGAILAAMALCVLMAGLARMPLLDRAWLRWLLAAGPALFIAVGLGGFALPGGFLSYPDGFQKPVIIVVETVLTASIAAILVLLVVGPAVTRGKP